MLDRTIRVEGVRWDWPRLRSLARSPSHGSGFVPIGVSLAIVAAVTVILLAAGPLLDLDHAAFGYLIPVIIAATRWGAAAGAV